MGTTVPFAKGMPRRHCSRRNTTLAPPCGAARAAARCKTRLRPALPGGEDPDPRASPKAAPSRAASTFSASIRGAGIRLGQSRQATSSCAVENAEPPVFSIFFDSSRISDDPFLSTAANAQNLVEADVSAMLQDPLRAPRETPPRRGESPLQRLRGGCAAPHGINGLVAFSACRVPLRDAILPVSCCNFDASVDGPPPG
jgi:hypothetical protein